MSITTKNRIASQGNRDQAGDFDQRYCGALEAEELTQRVRLLEGETHALDQTAKAQADAIDLNTSHVGTVQNAVLTLFNLRQLDLARIADLEATVQGLMDIVRTNVGLHQMAAKQICELVDGLYGSGPDDGIDPAFRAAFDKQCARLEAPQLGIVGTKSGFSEQGE